MANPTVEKIAKTNADMLTKSGQAAETMMKGSTEALTESGNAARAAVQELTKAARRHASGSPRTRKGRDGSRPGRALRTSGRRCGHRLEADRETSLS